MKFEHTETFGWEAALRGMRNPKESWSRNDTTVDGTTISIGSNDMDLATRLIKAGTEHRKFLRMIHVQVDMTAPLYLWKEYDTYKIATVANSTSFMHKGLAKKFTINDFENDLKIDTLYNAKNGHEVPIEDIQDDWKYIINRLNKLRDEYLETKDISIWRHIVQILPESWLQTRTIDLNYETLRTIYHQRRFHKLTEWHTFCDWVKTLPYAKEFITDGE